jgi:hypothetical protein
LNWNGDKRNRVIGQVVACRNQIKQKKYWAHEDGEEKKLEPVDPEENKAAVISLCTEINEWADTLTEEDRQAFLVHAFKHHPRQIRPWLGYKPDWTMMPAAVCKRHNEVVRLAHKSSLPHTYLLPGKPTNPDEAGPIVLDNGLEMVGIRKTSAHYVKWKAEWYRVYYPKLPSKSAVNRAIRLYLVGILLGRYVESITELMVYELFGVRDWILLQDRSQMAQESASTLFHLLTEPDIIGQLPKVE